MARSEIKMRSKRDPTHSNGVFLQIMSHNGSFYHSFFLCHTFPLFSIFYRCHSYPICSTQPKMRSSAQFIRPNLKTLRSLIRIRWTRINMRPQSCQSAFTNSFGDSIPFTHLTTWFNPRGRQLFVIVWFVHRIFGAHRLGNLQAMRRKTTTSLQQVKVTEVLLWSSPGMPLQEMMLKTCSLWYDYCNVNIFHVMENCEQKLCSWLKIGAKNISSVGPTKSGPF